MSVDEYTFSVGPVISILDPTLRADGVACAWVDDVEVAMEDVEDILSGKRSAASVKRASHDPGDEDRAR